MAAGKHRLTVYQGRDKQWYWTMRSPNGQVVAIGGEGYTRRTDARRATKRLFPWFWAKGANSAVKQLP